MILADDASGPTTTRLTNTHRSSRPIPTADPAATPFAHRTVLPLALPCALSLALLVLGFPASANAQNVEGEGAPAVPILGPPAPVPPAVITRNDEGGATVRAIRLDEPFRLDGELTESFYERLPSISGFIQMLPDPGAPPTERTEVWITYDDSNIYVSARAYASVPESEWIANEMRRDTNQLRQNDTFGVMFDTFYDRRNGVMFYTNPLGARADFAITNEGNPNSDWNPIWDVRTGRFPGGWTVEMEIPFRSLRYPPGTNQVWGLQLRRAIRRKNEWVYLTPIPPVGNGAMGSFRVSESGTLVGLQVPPGGTDLNIKPYGIAGFETDRTTTPEISNDGHADFGLDVKYGVTASLTADFTYNTDFAQVEVDEQQVNLTRFSLFFPEKRDFFLEGAGIFDFASRGAGVGGGGGFGGGGPVPTLFFSRRIGLQNGQAVPIIGGGRLTGKVGSFDVGALSIQTDEVGTAIPSTNFTVLRLRRDIFSRSSIGGLFTYRSNSTVADGSNRTYGVDGSFSFYDYLNFGGYYAVTETPGLESTGTPGLDSTDESYQGRLSYDGDLWGVAARHVLVGENFNPEVGFVRRAGFRQSALSGRYSPRPESIDWIRQLTFQASVDYFEHADSGFVETRTWQGSFQTEFENSDQFSLSYTDSYERLEEPFQIDADLVIPVGRYQFSEIEASYNFGLQRPYSGRLSLRRGSFYGGDITSVGFNRGRVQILREFSLEPSLSFNWIDLPQGDLETVLAVTRLNYSFSPRMFVSGLVQYNTSNDTFSTNLRLRWEYAPGSELFVVYTASRNTDVLDRFSELSTRGLVVKVTRLFRL